MYLDTKKMKLIGKYCIVSSNVNVIIFQRKAVSRTAFAVKNRIVNGRKNRMMGKPIRLGWFKFI